MTCEEFSNAFDVLLASYKTSAEFGKEYSDIDLVFDEYEKSIFLTKAQEDILTELYSGNRYNEGYEQTEELRRYLETLNKVEVLTDSSYSKYLNNFDKLEFYINDNTWFITYEVLSTSTKTLLVTPVTRDSLYKVLQNPFRNSAHQCLRIDGENNITIIGKNIKDASYEIHYISKPSPIILIDLENLTIEGESEQTECRLHVGLHNKILERAVALAMASKTNIQK